MKAIRKPLPAPSRSERAGPVRSAGAHRARGRWQAPARLPPARIEIAQVAAQAGCCRFDRGQAGPRRAQLRVTPLFTSDQGDSLTERGEELRDRRLLCRLGQEGEEALVGLRADGEHAQAMAVRERESGIDARQLRPEPPDAEVETALLGVVEQNDAPGAELGEPGREVVADGFVGVVPVDVEEVDAAVLESVRASSKGIWSRVEKPP